MAFFSPFRGGVHPDSFKELSATLPIMRLPIPPQLFVPLRQHAGSDAVAIVEPGSHVLKGQLIARAGNGLSAPVHAPTSGIVAAITPVTAAHPSGMKSNAIIIKPDRKDTPVKVPTLLDPFKLPRDELAQKIADAGIVGMGGASFPAAVKLSSAIDRHVETIVINGSECEPYLTADDRLMTERAEKIILGARLIRHVVGAQKIAIAIEDNKPNAISAMQKAAVGEQQLEIVVVPTRYPMGSAKQMIKAVTGHEVPAGGRSSDVGVLMHNVATAYAIAEALAESKPLTSRIVTVSGGAIVRPQNVEALIGTPARYLIEFCGGTVNTPTRLLLGGPMMGHVVQSLDVPLIKGVAGILALTDHEITNPQASPCIRCGRCVSACPMGLVPLEMANRSKHGDFDGANDYGLSDCILCGSCAYVCPSHIPLVHYFQYAKGHLNSQTAQSKRMQYTRQLAETRQERIDKATAAKAAAKAAKANRRKRSPAKTEKSPQGES